MRKLLVLVLAVLLLAGVVERSGYAMLPGMAVSGVGSAPPATGLTYLGGVSNNAPNGADVDVSLAALGLQEDDYLIIFCAISNDVAFEGAPFQAAINSPSPLTNGPFTTDADGSGAFHALEGARGFYRVPASVPTTVQCNGSGDGQDGAVGVVLGFRNVTNRSFSTSFNDHSPADPPDCGVGLNLVGQTGDEFIVICCGAYGAVSSGDATVPTAPSGFTNVISEFGNDTNDTKVACAINTTVAAGTNIQTFGAWNSALDGSGAGTAVWITEVYLTNP